MNLLSACSKSESEELANNKNQFSCFKILFAHTKNDINIYPFLVNDQITCLFWKSESKFVTTFHISKI